MLETIAFWHSLSRYLHLMRVDFRGKCTNRYFKAGSGERKNLTFLTYLTYIIREFLNVANFFYVSYVSYYTA